jgi:polysaccharide export outer membrane protein
MIKKIRFLLLFFPFVLISCVPTKDLIYLQSNNESNVLNAVNEVVSKPYRIQTHDILSIKIKAIDEKLVAMFANSTSGGPAAQSEQGAYFEGYSVDDHGAIRIPVLGEIAVLGYTTDEIRIKIEQLLLKEYFNKEANVFVSVKLAGFRYTINGEIGSTGSKVLYRDKVSILEAVANAGDINLIGDRKHVVIMRQMPQGTEMHTIDLTDVSVMQSPYFYLQPNDYIYVKPLKQKSWGTGTTGLQSFTTIISGLTLLISTYLIFKTL